MRGAAHARCRSCEKLSRATEPDALETHASHALLTYLSQALIIDAEEITEELLHQQGRVLKKRVCGCISADIRLVRRSLYIGTLALFIVGFLYAVFVIVV